VNDIILEQLAAAESTLTNEEKDLGVAIVDIGGGTTDLAVFCEGSLVHTHVLSIGGNHITNDIAVGLRTPVGEAEELKKRHGCALTARVPAQETVDVPSVGGRKPRELSRQVLSEIIQPRVEEIFRLVARDLAKAGFEDAATAGVVVTGGTSILEGVPEVAEAVFALPVRRGMPGDVGGLSDIVRSPIHSTAVGLALYGSRHAPRAANGATELSFGAALKRAAAWLGGMF